MSNFADWTLAKLERRFKLRMDMALPEMTAWIASEKLVSEQEKIFLEFYQSILKNNVFGWNEQELSLHFIGPVLALLNFTGLNINLFAGREFEGVVDGELLRGKPDGMIAAGHMEPDLPFFCLQEYKKSIDPNGDPFGQCLVAMLTAQALNERKFKIYGVVIVGEKWNFMLLDGDRYAISPGYSALDQDLFHIFNMLKNMKNYIIENN